jgi:hypothetical protein
MISLVYLENIPVKNKKVEITMVCDIDRYMMAVRAGRQLS